MLLSQYTMVLLILATISLIIGLVFTFRIAQKQKLSTEYDTDISDRIENNHFTLNPVFLTYIISLVLVLIYLGYMMMTT